MAKITVVEHARKEYKCEKCGGAIRIGDPYKHVSPRPHPGAYATKRIRCDKCPTWKHWELIYGKMRAVYEAQDGIETAWAEWDGTAGGYESLQDEVKNFAETIREVAGEYRESAENIESGFGHSTFQSDELNEKADGLESWADEIENCLTVELPDTDLPYTDEERQEALDQFRDDVDSELSPIYECPV